MVPVDQPGGNLAVLEDRLDQLDRLEGLPVHIAAHLGVSPED
jgi:hypothetical protein